MYWGGEEELGEEEVFHRPAEKEVNHGLKGSS